MPTKKPDDFATLERVRAELEAKLEELSTVEGAPLPIEEARVQLRAWIESEGKQFDAAVSYFARSGFAGPFQLLSLGDGTQGRVAPAPQPSELRYGGLQGGDADLTVSSRQRFLERAGIRSAASDLSALLCALMPDRVEQLLADRLERHLRELPLVLPAEEREARLVTLRAEVLEREVEEERIVRRLEERGVEVNRRPEARPDVVLALDLGRVTARAA